MSTEPVTLQQVKTHLRLGSSTREDAYLTIMIGAARRAIENVTGRDITATLPTLDERDQAVVAQACLLLVGQWYSNREAGGTNVIEMPLAVKWLLDPLRKMAV